MTPFLKVTISVTFLLLLLTSCIHRGYYRYGGTFPNAQLPAYDAQIGILDPRGSFGDADARRIVHGMLNKVFRKCGNVRVATEDQLNELGQLPAIYGKQLSATNLQWFVEHTDLDYLVLPDVGPGTFTNLPEPQMSVPADREASVMLAVYDLADGGLLKEIAVTGRLDLDENRQIWEVDATEQSMSLTALRKAMKRLGKYTDCQ